MQSVYHICKVVCQLTMNYWVFDFYYLVAVLASLNSNKHLIDLTAHQLVCGL